MKIGVIGCSGRMGQTFLSEILKTDEVQLSGGSEIQGSPLIGKDIAVLTNTEETGLFITGDNAQLIAHSDAVIDFTAPKNTLNIAKLAAESGTIHVTGTTGINEDEMQILQSYSDKTPIIWSSNMSVGVNLLNNLTKMVSSKLGVDFDIEILEMHHNQKVDSPSGTALTLGEYAAEGRSVSLSEVATKVRDGNIGKRPEGEIGFATLRGGDVIGDHTVIFAGNGERIELTHKASNRSIYAQGAVRACLWAKGKGSGFYNMNDVLGF